MQKFDPISLTPIKTQTDTGAVSRKKFWSKTALLFIWVVIIPFFVFFPFSIFFILRTSIHEIPRETIVHIAQTASLQSVAAILLYAFHVQFRPALGQVLLIVCLVFGTYLFYIVFTRDDYIRPLVLFAVIWTALVLLPFARAVSRLRRGLIGIVPNGGSLDIIAPFQSSVVNIVSPDVPIERFSSIAADFSRPMDPGWVRFIARAMMMNRRVLHVAELHEYETRMVAVSHFEPEHLKGISNQIRATLKRIIDVVAVVLAAPFALVLFALGALAIYLESGRPVLFRQSRLGLNNVPFTIYKLRTMLDDGRVAAAEARDPRVTPIGSILRRTRIDELPQLWNILTGEMSFVGPRPEWTELAYRYSKDIPEYNYRHLVVPGLTGWAQVKAGASSTVDEARIKLSYDLYYAKHQSIMFDFEILARTVLALLWGKNIR
jgi:lipopolysaccharide/colanic/teichoic acid biosynthesis glycosyltransferase